ncbi:MAG: hypothetical protein FWH57_13260 [Oscillospiraceae bacterium]|nr:hypothetical protein [Oscillospiraceae bacterium]
MEQLIDPEQQSRPLDSTLPDEIYLCDNCGQKINKSFKYCNACGKPTRFYVNQEKVNENADKSVPKGAPYPNTATRPMAPGDSMENTKTNQMGSTVAQKTQYPAYSVQRNLQYNNKPRAVENKLSGGAVAWLIICTVVNSALGVLSAIVAVQVGQLGILALSALISFGAVAGYILLLVRKKPGLYIVIACAAIAIVLNIITANIWPAVFGFLNPLITWVLTRKLWDSPQSVDNTVYQNINRTQVPRQPQVPKVPPLATTYQRSGGDAILRASSGKYLCPSCNADLGPAINREAGAIYDVFKNMGPVGGLVTMDTARNKLIYEQGITCVCGKTLKPYKKSDYM